MKMSRFSVTFEKTVDVVIYAPEGTDPVVVKKAAEDAASLGLDGWEEPDYEATLGVGHRVEIDDEDLVRSELNSYGFRRCMSPVLTHEDAVVLSDDGAELVTAEDATWWEALRVPGPGGVVVEARRDR